MGMSSEIDKLAAALVKVQASIKPAVKSSANPFFKSHYADLGEIWNACREALTANGIAVVQGGDGDCLQTTLLHTSGQWISGSFRLMAIKPDPQAQGSAMTYLRRYSLAAMVGVVTEDDDGEAAMARGAPPPPTAVSPRQSVPRVPSHPGPQGHPEQWKTWAEVKVALPPRELSDWMASDDYGESMADCKKASPKLHAWIEQQIRERNAA